MYLLVWWVFTRVGGGTAEAVAALGTPMESPVPVKWAKGGARSKRDKDSKILAAMDVGLKDHRKRLESLMSRMAQLERVEGAIFTEPVDRSTGDTDEFGLPIAPDAARDLQHARDVLGAMGRLRDRQSEEVDRQRARYEQACRELRMQESAVEMLGERVGALERGLGAGVVVLEGPAIE